MPVRICGGPNDLGIMDDAGPWRAPRRQTRSAGGSPPTERSRPTIASIARRVDGAKFVVLKSFYSLVDVVRGVSQPLRGRVSANMNVRDPRSPTVLATSTAPPGDLLFTRRRRQRHLAPCPPSDAQRTELRAFRDWTRDNITML